MDPYTLDDMSQLACAYSNQLRFLKAEELYMSVIQSREKILGERHVITIGSMIDLASTYIKLAHYHEAVELHLKVLKLREEMLGEKHPSTIYSMVLLADDFLSNSVTGKWSNVWRAFELRKRILGDKHLYSEYYVEPIRDNATPESIYRGGTYCFCDCNFV